MADVLPFAGTRFNIKENDLDLTKIIVPPYDVIQGDLQQKFHDRDPLNMVRLVRGFEAPGDDEYNNRYTRAAECYRDWKTRNLIVDEQRKCFYVYEHEFKLPNQKKVFKRRGFFGLVKLQDYRSGKIRAHQMTFEAPKVDRLFLLKATMVNFEPVFSVFRDEEKEIAPILDTATSNPPNEEFQTADGETHRIWLMHRKDPILTINQAMKNKRLFMVDGHHRYETALLYRDEMRENTGRRDGRQPYDFMMMYLNDASDDGICATSMHRVLARDLGSDIDLQEVLEDLEEYFDVTPFKIDMSDLDKASKDAEKHLAPKKGVQTQFLMVLPNGKAFELRMKKDADLDEMIDEEFMSDAMKSQDVTILHRYVIGRGWLGNPEIEVDEDDIAYCKDIQTSLERLATRKGSVAFLMNPITKEEVLELADNGELMPPHTTYFYPKVQSGLIMRDLQVGFG